MSCAKSWVTVRRKDPITCRKTMRRWTWIVAEPVVLTVIVINAVALFLDAFPSIHDAAGTGLFWIDYFCLIFFILEAVIKIRRDGSFTVYWSDRWNAFDFSIVVLSLPLITSPLFNGALSDLAVILIPRMGRLFRFARLMRFVPDANRIFKDILRAVRVSVGLFLVLLILNLFLAMGATLMFGRLEIAGEYFGDPLRSMYSLFKVFTIEGWYEIPEILATRGASANYVLALRVYFTVSVMLGGLLGLSIANAVFVDAMVQDNTDVLEAKVDDLHEEIQSLRASIAKESP